MILDLLEYIFTIGFLLIIISYYFLLFYKKKKPKKHENFNSISVIIPAHNEENHIVSCVNSVLNSYFKGTKNIFIIDDGSTDNTYKKILEFKQKNSKEKITILKTSHIGKSASINLALKKTNSDLIAIVDADSIISINALEDMAKEVSRKNVVASSCVIKVKNRKKYICMWYQIEQLYNSLIRSIFSKVNANIATPGPLSVYRRKALMEIDGFSTDGFSEDLDITIRLIRKGYNVGFCETAQSETILPYKPKEVIRQRTRFARGMLKIFKKHLKLNNKIIDYYTLPLFLFTYVQAVIMGSFTIYQIVSGYYQYYFSKDIIFNLEVFRFFFDWFSIVGFIKWSYNVIAGNIALTFITLAGIISTLLTYPLYLFAIIRYEKKFDIFHLIPLLFMSPFWWFIMVLYIICIPELFRKKQFNKWKKNE